MSDQDSLQEELNRALLPGTQLLQARESQGMSVIDAALALKITETYVRALENDDYTELPQSTFVRGYLRNYAKILGLNGDELAAVYDQHISGQSEKVLKLDVEKTIKPLRAHSTPSPANALILVLVVSLGGLSYFLWNNWLKPEVSSAVVLEQSINAEDASLAISEPENAQALPSETIVTEKPELVESSEETTNILPETDHITPAAEASKAVEPDGLMKSLMISFKGECWVEVTDATGKIIVSSVQQSGTAIDLQVLPPVNVRFGNSPAVDQIVFAGDTVSNPQSRSRVASIQLKVNEQG
ncbi:RodZ domain-containing protein [uncultured Endozoicomonas sp.]|uniref:RodZ domain-containing protein n=1 Tax=uncultured Endozoicomonas sp. TaxID=432652 RepID=UPI0026345B93|nr:RodZ domain-containing protein [uncultured Endozoicomonas sp.]